MQQKNRSFLLTLIGVAGVFIVLGVVLWLLFDGAIPVLNPTGSIARDQRNLMRDATLLMLIVVLPVFYLAFHFLWKYRAGNAKADYDPNLAQHPAAELIWWGGPCVIILLLAILTYVRTHQLDPFKPIESDAKPITIQAVALDWKWLFIFPEEGIATVNYFEFPVETPLDFRITADAPMNSLWIPSLGGQMYAMPGMGSQLYLIADQEGVVEGRSSNLSGKGFAGMTFKAKAGSREEFQAWVQQVQLTGEPLDWMVYEQLAQPTEYAPVAYYVLEEKNLFHAIIQKYMRP